MSIVTAEELEFAIREKKKEFRKLSLYQKIKKWKKHRLEIWYLRYNIKNNPRVRHDL